MSISVASGGMPQLDLVQAKGVGKCITGSHTEVAMRRHLPHWGRRVFKYVLRTECFWHFGHFRVAFLNSQRGTVEPVDAVSRRNLGHVEFTEVYDAAGCVGLILVVHCIESGEVRVGAALQPADMHMVHTVLELLEGGPGTEGFLALAELYRGLRVRQGVLNSVERHEEASAGNERGLVL